MSVVNKLRVAVTILLVSLFVAQSSGCNRYGWHLAGEVVQAVATVAVVAAVLSHHDDHYHSHWCGHEYVIIENRRVYHYQDRWEYYDHRDGRWYHYEDGHIH